MYTDCWTRLISGLELEISRSASIHLRTRRGMPPSDSFSLSSSSAEANSISCSEGRSTSSSDRSTSISKSTCPGIGTRLGRRRTPSSAARSTSIIVLNSAICEPLEKSKCLSTAVSNGAANERQICVLSNDRIIPYVAIA